MPGPGWSVMQFILGFTVGHVTSSDMSYFKALSIHAATRKEQPETS